jgi:uncharacterized protein (TIGR02300 family)
LLLLTAGPQGAKGSPAFRTKFKDSRSVAKPELGIKRLCAGCGAKFYDLNKDPITCPKCGTVYQVMATTTRVRAEPRAAAVAAAVPEKELETPEVADAEFVSLEEADAEATGGKVPAAETEEEEVDVGDESLDDAAFLEPDEDEDEDVTDIIGGDIENEEET